MSTITSRTLSFCLILSLLTCLIVPASAASSDPIEITPHDSAYFSQRRLSISPGGNGQLQISLFVAAKAIMSEVGATQIVVYEKQANGSYSAVRTYTRYNHSGMIQKNRATAQINIVYPGTPGKYYFVTAACYAKNASGSQTTWMGPSAIKA